MGREFSGLRLPDISLLVPTRERPNNLARFYASVMSTATNPKRIEVIAYVDDDDDNYDDIAYPRLTIVRGPQIVLAEAWNECWRNSVGDYLGLMGDDIVFRTSGWDDTVRSAFSGFADGIGYFYGDDGGPAGRDFGTHGFIHRNWAEAVGYFVPPYFSADYVDAWLDDVSRKLGRHIFMDILTEHMHPGYDKAVNDQVYKTARERNATDRVGDKFRDLRKAREEDAQKLRSFMDDFNSNRRA